MVVRGLPTTVHTVRLALRSPRAADGPALAEALEESLPTLAPWFRWAEALARWGAREDLAVRASVLEHRNAQGLERGWLLWEGDRVVGEVVLRGEGLGFGVVGFHVWLRPSAVGQGLATEAGRAAAATAGLVADWIEAECGPANARSRRLLCGLGFERFGATRDRERYVLGCGPLPC